MQSREPVTTVSFFTRKSSHQSVRVRGRCFVSCFVLLLVFIPFCFVLCFGFLLCSLVCLPVVHVAFPVYHVTLSLPARESGV